MDGTQSDSTKSVKKYRTSPDQETTAWPPGVPYIIGNEGCERFSYYGMHSILYVYMAEYLYRTHAAYASRPEDTATSHFHLFNAGVYALPMIGAIIADRLLGKYATIVALSLVYCMGHAVLSITEGTLWGLWIGLGLIAVGSGGIKPCVSAHVGDQFGKGNWFRLRSIYQAFYFIINFGSTFSMLLIPGIFEWRNTQTGFLREHAVSIAFAIPGVLMFLATIAFFMGRNVFVHVPPRPGGSLGLLDSLCSIALFLVFGHLFFTAGKPLWVLLSCSLGFLAMGAILFVVRQRIEPDDGFLAVIVYSVTGWQGGKQKKVDAADAHLAPDDDLAKSRLFAPAVRHYGAEVARGPHAVVKIMSVFIVVTIFWALFDQSGSSWIRQAELMRTVTFMGIDWLPSRMQAINPILVMVLIPFFNYVAYPWAEKLGFKMTALRRMTVGMFIAPLSFVAVAIIQKSVEDAGRGTVNILWQTVPYTILTIAEVLVSTTGLEFAYSQAPKRMKSTIMGFWLLTIAFGNVLVSVLAEFGKLPLVQFFWLFAGLMVVAGLLFGLRAHFYVERDVVQE